MLEIDTLIFLDDGAALRLDDVPGDDPAATTLLANFSSLGGALVITDADRRVLLADTLRILIPTFCLGGLARLIREGRQVVDFFDHEEIVTLAIQNGAVDLFGAQFESLSLPLAPYVAAQRRCGERYLALARRLWRHDPDRADALADLESGLAEISEPAPP